MGMLGALYSVGGLLGAHYVAKKGLKEIGKAMAPDMPEPEKEKVMPIPDEGRASAQSRQHSARKRKSKSGRVASILSGDKLGG